MPRRAVPAEDRVARICRSSVAALPVSGAAVSVFTGTGEPGTGGADSGALGTVAATDELAARVEELQFTLGEGPGIDAFIRGSPVLVSDLAAPAGPGGLRWPAFTPAATAAGVKALFAFPLHVGAVVLGALSLHRTEPVTLTGTDLGRALTAADAAVLALLDVDSTLGDPFVEAVASGRPVAPAFVRAEVHQATGMIMVQLGVSAAEAFVRLRGYAFARDQLVGQVARAVVGGDLRFGGDT